MEQAAFVSKYMPTSILYIDRIGVDQFSGMEYRSMPIHTETVITSLTWGNFGY